MEKLLILVLLFGMCWAEQKDLTGKVFVFPRETATSHVRLLPQSTIRDSATVCLKFFTDLTRDHTLFSLSTPSKSNGFLVSKQHNVEAISLFISDANIGFQSLSFPLNTWHTICATWRDNGVAQLWLNGRPTAIKFVQSTSLIGNPIVILGQEQDSYGGTFDVKQSFIGMISDVHMWDYVVPPSAIKRYAAGKNFKPGNVISWRSLEYEITGVIYEQEETEVM
ncbi:unnamed protein product [Ophioblennius macclurei]